MHQIICNEYIKGVATVKKVADYTQDRIKLVLAEFENLYGYVPNVEVGEYTYGLPIIKWWGEKTKLKIGKFCSIAKDVTIFLGGEHQTSSLTTYPFLYYPFEWSGLEKIKEISIRPSKGDVTIGNDVWIGANVIILTGVNIGDGAVIGAGSVIVKDVPPYAIVAGNPAKIIKNRFSDEVVELLIEMKWWDWKFSKINEAIQFLITEDIDKLVNFNRNY